jgi:hypothetical protein
VASDAPEWYREYFAVRGGTPSAAAALEAVRSTPAVTFTYAGPSPASPRPAGGGAGVEAYIRQAAATRGIDPDIAVRVAQSEGGLVPNRTGAFPTGKSFWPFQLHYGGAGTPYAQYGTVAGMGNAFTQKTGWQPGDPEAWRAATDYALDAAKQQGWGAWYGARNQGITGFQGINGGAAAAGAAGPALGPAERAPQTGPTASGGAAPDWYREAVAMGAVGGAGGHRPAGAPSPAGGTPAPAGGDVGKQAIAASWALSQLGSKDFYNLCQRFIEQAYGTGGQFGSAAAAGKALFKTADPAQADVGDLVFFRPDASNGYAGHAAVYLGNGEMVGATNAGVTRDNLLTNPYWRNLLVGFGDPPSGWQGRSSTESLVKGATQLLGTARQAVAGAAGAAGAAVQGAHGAAPDWYREWAASRGRS